MTTLDKAHQLALELDKALQDAAREGRDVWRAGVPLKEVINAIELERSK